MPGQLKRAAVRVLVSMAWGALLGGLYAALVGTAHLGTYRRWDGIPAFAAGCILVGVGLGLLGYLVWAVSGEAARERAGSGPPPRSSRLPGPARRTVGPRPVRRCARAAGDRIAARRGCLSGLCRSFESPN
jgi:hypothetical protein